MSVKTGWAAAFGLALLGLSGSIAAAGNSLFDQINRAGEQRMLAQRIAKSFSQLGLNVQPLVAKQELDQAVRRFEENLDFLDKESGAAARTSLNALRESWAPMRNGTRGQPTTESARQLANRANDVLAAAENVVRDLQNSATVAAMSGGRLVSQAGRQRMLSQRIVKAYLLISWGDTTPALREELDAAVNEFSGALEALRLQRGLSAAVQRELEEMAQHWEWMRTALAAEGASSYRLIVAESGDAILQSADRLTALLVAGR